MFGLTQDQWRDLLLSVNTHRAERRLSPYVAAEYIETALKSTDIESLALSLGFDGTTTLTKIRRIGRLPNGLAAVVSWGRTKGGLSMSAASELTRLGDDAVEAIRAAVVNGLTKEEAVQVVQIRRRSGKSVRECVEQAVLTRPLVERMELIVGSILSSRARSAIGDRNEDPTGILRRAMAQSYPAVICKSVRVNADKFSLLLSEEDAARLRACITDGSIEKAVTRLIEDLT